MLKYIIKGKRDLGKMKTLKSKHLDKILPGVIILFAIALRLFMLSSHDLWYDEASVYRNAKNLTKVILQDEKVIYPTHPPLYYILLNFWIKVFPDSAFWLRGFSALAAIIATYLVFRFCIFFMSKEIALIAAFLFAVSPLNIWYSQEVGLYNLSLLFVSTAVFLLAKCLKEASLLNWFYLYVLLVVSLGTNHYSWFIIFGIWFIVLLNKEFRQHIRKWILLNILLLLFILPYLLVFIKNLVNILNANFWINRPTLKSILITFGNFNAGYNADHKTYIFQYLIFFSLFVSGVLYGLRRYKSIFKILITILITGILIPYVISRWLPVYIDRHLMLFSPFYYIVIAAGIESIKPNGVKIVIFSALSFIIFLSLNNYYCDTLTSPIEYHLGSYTKKTFKPLVHYLKGMADKNKDISIVYATPSVRNSVYYYWKEDNNPEYFYFFIPETMDDYWRGVVTRASVKWPKSYIDLSRPICIDIENKKDILLITGSWAREGLWDMNSAAVKDWMDKRFYKVSDVEFDGIWVTCYKRK